MASECQKSDCRRPQFFTPFPRGRWPPEPPKETVFGSAFLEPPSLNSGIHPIEYNKQLHFVSTDQVQSETARPRIWYSFHIWLSFQLTFPGINLYTCANSLNIVIACVSLQLFWLLLLQMAFKYLSWALFPLLVCYSVYSLIYVEHKGWYSWILSMLYGFLLTFGEFNMKYHELPYSYLTLVCTGTH